MSRPLLSVCIATMNRGKFIGETLESILGQSTDEVEVVILDGGSRDDTPEVVRGFQARHPRIRYVRQDAPGGVDQDYDRTVELAEGDYCWMMTDDDLLKPGAIPRVLSEIRKGYDLVVVNAEVRNTDLSRVIEKRRMRMREDRTYTANDWRRFFIDTTNYLSFIGGVVIRRSLWRSRERAPYYGTVFIHVGVIFQAHLPGSILAISEPLISIRYGNAHWSPKHFEIWMFKWPGLVWSLPHLEESDKARICPREPWRHIPRLVHKRALGVYSAAEFRKWILPRPMSRLKRFLSWAVAISPGFPLNLAFLLLITRWGRLSMTHIDLANSRFHYSRLFNLSPPRTVWRRA